MRRAGRAFFPRSLQPGAAVARTRGSVIERPRAELMLPSSWTPAPGEQTTRWTAAEGRGGETGRACLLIHEHCGNARDSGYAPNEAPNMTTNISTVAECDIKVRINKLFLKLKSYKTMQLHKD